MFPSAFGCQAIARRCDEISVDQESYGLLNSFVWCFFLKGLVQGSDGNVESASFLRFFVKEMQDSFGQRLNLDHYLPYSIKGTIHWSPNSRHTVNNVTVDLGRLESSIAANHTHGQLRIREYYAAGSRTQDPFHLWSIGPDSSSPAN
jgi:hypothetical protein